MDEEPKQFDFVELPAPAASAEVTPKKRRGRKPKKPKVAQRKVRNMRVEDLGHGKRYSPDDTSVPADLPASPPREAAPDRKALLLKAITALQLLDKADARFVAGLFI